MHRLVSKLIVYKSEEKDSILLKLAGVYRRFDEDAYDRDELISEIYLQINRLLDLSTRYGFDKNLWHNYLAYILATTENPFTLVSEKVGANEGSVNSFAKGDFAVFKELFDFDFSKIERALEIDCFATITNYSAVSKSEQIFNKSVSEKVLLLSEAIEQASNVEEVYTAVTDFYKVYGVGELGLNKAFRISSDGGKLLIPITSTEDVLLSDLVGYEDEKRRLIENTEAFVEGRRANNVLLYGDAGTGKSTSIKAILNQYYGRGLRMIEVYKHEFSYLSKIIDEVKNRNYRFIIFMDDLSFEEFEIEYKYLKAIIEGGLETKPENLLIYATSNRRHLIRETWGDRSDMSQDELHHSDTMQEKLSLAARFGISIGYHKPSTKEYYKIVFELAKAHPEITLGHEDLEIEANRWGLRHGGLSGRTAQQFINYLTGTTAEE